MISMSKLPSKFMLGHRPQYGVSVKCQVLLIAFAQLSHNYIRLTFNAFVPSDVQKTGLPSYTQAPS